MHSDNFLTELTRDKTVTQSFVHETKEGSFFWGFVMVGPGGGGGMERIIWITGDNQQKANLSTASLLTFGEVVKTREVGRESSVAEISNF